MNSNNIKWNYTSYPIERDKLLLELDRDIVIRWQRNCLKTNNVSPNKVMNVNSISRSTTPFNTRRRVPYYVIRDIVTNKKAYAGNLNELNENKERWDIQTQIKNEAVEKLKYPSSPKYKRRDHESFMNTFHIDTRDDCFITKMKSITSISCEEI